MAYKPKSKNWPLLNDVRPKMMKAWQDCQWLRKTCGKGACPICGRIKRDRRRHIDKGEDPDAMESVFEDVGNVFKETFELLHKNAERLGNDFGDSKERSAAESPEPRDFPLYNEAYRWRQGIMEMAEAGDILTGVWISTEAGQDLLWYANTLIAKIYRQLTNVWDLERADADGKEFMDPEFKYTGFVLKRVFAFLDTALLELSASNGSQKGEFTLARLTLNGIYKKIEGRYIGFR